MSTPYRRDLERLQYWQGQMLRSRDARDQGRFDALRRELHNRALHATGGIAFGLQVQLAADDPHRVEVACGLAYDTRGRELVLQRARRAALPTQPSWLVLRMRAAVRDSASCCLPSDRGCLSQDARLLEDDVELAWIAIASHDASGGAVLARCDGKQLDSAFMPMRSRPLARPRLARGETVKGDTPWEPWIVEQPDGQGGIVSKVVGVQTHIDTTACGFTQTPRYVANVQAQVWDLATAEFAPAFFPQVADAAADGFTFRLLMTEIARRRYGAWFGRARVASTTRGIGDQLSIEVDDSAVFKQGDVIAQLRPRARTMVTLAASTKSKLTLDGPLAGVQAGSTLAVGNLPRMTAVTGVLPDDPAMVAVYTASPAVKKGDVLQRTSDRVLALIDRAAAGILTVEEPPPNWKTTDALVVARMTGAADVKSAALSADGKSLVLDLKSATHGIEVGMEIVMQDGEKQPLASTPPKVTTRSGATIEAQPVPSAADIAAVARVAPFAGGLTIQSLSAKNRSIVQVDDVAPFAIGDFVAPADDPTQIAVVEQVQKGKKQLGLSSALGGLAVGSKLVAADWQCATTIAAFDPKHPQVVQVGRADAARAGDLVALRATDDVASPVSVAGASAATLTLAAPLVGAVRLDTLAVGRFGRVATVVSQQAQETQLTIAEAGALVAGDCVMLWPASGSVSAESAVVQVASAGGAQVVLADSLGALGPGDRIATVQWRDSVSVTSVDAAHPAQVGIDGDTAFGANDVVGAVSYHADASNGAYVQKIEGKVLTLSAGIAQGDGIVDQGWIDGGIVGPAALAWQPSVPSSFPAPWQPVVRMDTLEGLDSRTLATAYGLDLVTGVFQSRAVLPFVLDAAGEHLLMFSPASTPAYRFRPETLSLITSFNNDFPAAFVTFAQKQQLVVRWFGCQQEFPPAGGCPGQAPWDPCATGA